ncbi:efflux transporter outer membrane subunit [Hydrogenophaga palleronii]|uniref:efflux transporter outer membrane subunit n=1 Tax=Hydrogenophaga palleronii TaxID=65655 RepID=UPI0008250B71|nr:efflux transporter outer membrane subunit [Hydrogenophaga palleronii]
MPRPHAARIERRWTAIAAAAVTALALGACAQLPPVQPDVQGVVAPTLGQPLPVAETRPAALTDAQALAWVQHPGLRQTVAQALSHNRDLRVAVLNIDRARAQYGITSAAQLPTVAAAGQGSRSRTAADLSSAGVSSVSSQYTAQLAITSFELDLWGRVRNLNEAALQQFLQSEVNQQSVRITLVADVTNAWLNLAADQARLKLAQDTLAGREKAYQLTERIHALGATSGLVLAQNRSTVETARGDVAAFTAQVAKDRNALDLLVGSGLNPDWLPTADTLRGEPAQAPAALLVLPAELPSSLLLARPDVRASEYNLRALSANVAAARAALFPTISLTTSVGTGSRELDNLFASGNGTWSFVPQIRWPIFDGGSARAAVDVAQANREIAVNQYEKAIQTAFREASDALAERTQWQARLDAQEAVVAANAQAFELSEARFTAGVDNYLTVLDAQRSLYAAQQVLIALRLSEQANRIALWKVLGG